MGNRSKKMENLLYNHPVGHIIEYFIINLKSSGEIMDKTAGDFLRRRLGKKMDQNGLLAKEEEFEPIVCDWMFGLLKGKFQDTPGEAIMRLMAQLENINQVIYKELEKGVQDPEGAWGWLSKKRDDLQSLGRGLADREIYDYFTKCKIV